MVENSKKLCQILHEMDENNSIKDIKTGETHSGDDAFISMDADMLETKFIEKENNLYRENETKPMFEIIGGNNGKKD